VVEPDEGGDSPLEAGGAVPVLCRQGAVLVSAFHPELTPDRRIHALFVSMINGTSIEETSGMPRSDREGR
jgi:pyridoxal 5'-phosphate synthase pdxT subunit